MSTDLLLGSAIACYSGAARRDDSGSVGWWKEIAQLQSCRKVTAGRLIGDVMAPPHNCSGIRKETCVADGESGCCRGNQWLAVSCTNQQE